MTLKGPVRSDHPRREPGLSMADQRSDAPTTLDERTQYEAREASRSPILAVAVGIDPVPLRQVTGRARFAVVHRQRTWRILTVLKSQQD